MALRWIALLTLGLGCMHSGGVLVSSESEFRGGLPASITRVESFGLWSHGERRGSLRIVVTRSCRPEHCFDRSFLQWLDTRRDEQGRFLAAVEGETSEIDELGNSVLVEKITPAPSVKNPARFQIESANSHSGELGAICVTPGAPGSYAAHDGPCR